MATSPSVNVVDRPLTVRARLQELGVTEGILVEAIRAGEAAAASCTANHPPIFGGLLRYAETVRALRERLVPEGWTRDDTKNFSTAVSPDGRIAIAVARGDEATGDVDATPSTKYPKGAATIEAVERNLLLPFDETAIAANASSGIEPTRSTWFLLHSRENGTLKCELSRPTAVDRSGHVEEWDERLILAPIQLDPVRIAVPSEEPVESVVTVRRRDAV